MLTEIRTPAKDAAGTSIKAIATKDLRTKLVTFILLPLGYGITLKKGAASNFVPTEQVLYPAYPTLKHTNSVEVSKFMRRSSMTWIQRRWQWTAMFRRDRALPGGLVYT